LPINRRGFFRAGFLAVETKIKTMKCRKLILIFAAGILQVAHADQTPPADITLNGLMTIFDQKQALFKVREQNSMKEEDVTLSEGQESGGIELVSVDLKNATIKVNNHGVPQTIEITQAQLAPYAADDVPADFDFSNAKSYSEIVVWQNRMLDAQSQNGNGQIGSSSGYGIGSGNAGNSGNSSAPNNGTSANNSSDAGNSNDSSAPKMDPWWVRGSKAVEAARIQSAQAVMNGQADPQPLTPLTPPGTPAALIGSDQLFFDHM
jgi:hypothetical protein